MKNISRFTLELELNSARWVYNTKINEGLVDAVSEGSSTEETGEDSAKLSVREGRKQALRDFRDLNDELIVDIEGDHGVEDFKFVRKPVEKLKNETSNKVQSLLLGTRSGSRALTQQLGISNRYRHFVLDVFNQAENAEHTIGDVDFALSTVDYTSNAFNKRLGYEENRSHDYTHWRQWFRNSEKEKAIFDARSQVVKDVFADISGRLNARKSTAEQSVEDHSQRVTAEFEMMSPDEKAEFLGQVQKEVSSGTPPRVHLDTIYIRGIMENLNVHQRIEVYKKAKLDQSVANRNLESISEGDQHIKKGYRESRRALDHYSENLELDTLRGNLNLGGAQIKSKDLLGDASFLSELQGYLDQHGSINRNPQYFNRYSADFKLGDYENFIAYCHILQTNDDDVCNTIPANFKKEILSCLKWVEEQEEVNDEDIEGFSPSFVDLDNGLQTQFTAFESLVSTTLNGISNLGRASSVLSDIDSCMGAVVQQVANFEDIKSKNNLSDDELGFLEAKYENLKKIGTTVLPRLKKKYEDKQKEYENLEKEYNQYNRLRTTYAATRDNISATSPTPDIQINTGSAPSGGTPSQTHVVANQDEITAWGKANAKWEAAEEKLVEIRSLSGVVSGPPITTSYSFSFLDTELNDFLHSINADLQVISNDRTEKGRTVRSNPNTPNHLFRNYLQREASKDQNKKLDEFLETNRKKSLGYLRGKKVGSAVTIKSLPYQHGNPPTSSEVLQDPNPRNELLRECIVISNPDKGNGSVLYNEALNCIVIVQEGEASGRVELIVLPAPSDIDIAAEGLPSGFDMGVAQQYSATPVSIVAR